MRGHRASSLGDIGSGRVVAHDSKQASGPINQSQLPRPGSSLSPLYTRSRTGGGGGKEKIAFPVASADDNTVADALERLQARRFGACYPSLFDSFIGRPITRNVKEGLIAQ